MRTECVRPARAEDASRLAEILIFGKRTAYRGIFHDDAVSFGEMQVLPLALGYRDDPARLAGMRVYDDGLVRGLMHLRVDGDAAELVELYVDPFFQEQGVGRALVAAAEAEARAAGARTLHLWVLEKNAPGRRFYEAQGLAPTGERMREEGTPEWLLDYRKAL